MGAKTPPLYRTACAIETEADLSASTAELWRIHDQTGLNERDDRAAPSTSLLDLKIELAQRVYHNCHFCERRCYTDRAEMPGFCGVQESKYSSEFLHYGEERELIPSHTIFFTGCTLKCVFCQNWEIARHPQNGVSSTPEALAFKICSRAITGSRNVNWVGGDPTPHILTIFKTLQALVDLGQRSEVDTRFLDIPVVFNSNAYYSVEAMKLLNGVVDIYLSDFKYGDDTCAQRYSRAGAYVETIKRNLLASRERLMIRHLVMPGHVQCCTRPIAEWVHETMPEAKFNLMFQYTPHNVKEFPEIDRYVSDDERRQALLVAKDLNLI